MYTAVVVEDELLVRIGIKVSISGSGLPVRVAADVADGLEAYKLIQENPPDILITDLRLPSMDGMELIRRIREDGCDCKVLIISCMEDFETLRAAISFKITGYLFKATMTTQELTDALEDIVEEIQKEGRKTQPVSNAGEQPPRFGGEPPWEQICGKLPAAPKSVGYFTAKQPHTGGIAMATLTELLKNKLPDASLFLYEDGVTAVSCRALEEVSFCDAVKSLMNLAHASMGLDLFCGWESVKPGAQELTTAFRAARELAGYTRYIGTERCSFEKISESTLLPFKRELRDLEKLSVPGAEEAFHSSLRNLELALPQGWESVRAALDHVLAAAGMGEDEEDRSRILEMDAAFDTLRALSRYFDASIATLRESGLRLELRRALDYIDKNLGEPLQLQTIAEIAGLSANYFSNLFTHECGISYVAYLTRVRLERAKELLPDNSLSLGEIAAACGFRDESYFSRIFKSKCGISPSKWRRWNIGQTER